MSSMRSATVLIILSVCQVGVLAREQTNEQFSFMRRSFLLVQMVLTLLGMNVRAHHPRRSFLSNNRSP